MNRWAIGISLLMACCAAARAQTAESNPPRPDFGAPQLIGRSADAKPATGAARSLKAPASIAATVEIGAIVDRKRLAQAGSAEQVEAADQADEEDAAVVAAGNPTLPPFE